MSTVATISRSVTTVALGDRWRHLARTYRYVRRHPLGRWLLLVVWVGLGIALTTPYTALIPIALERREVLRAAGVHIE